MTNEVITQEKVLRQAEEALKAVNDVKGILEKKTEQLDAIEKDVEARVTEIASKAAEQSQSFQLKLEAKEKADTERFNQLEAVLQRLPAEKRDDAKGIEKKLTEAFNKFARVGESFPRLPMDEFLKQTPEFKELSVAIQTEGGYTVLPALGAMMQQRVFETSPIRAVASQITIGTDRLVFVTDNDEAASGGWAGEKQTRTTTDTPDFGKQEIPVHEQYAKPKVTQQMLDDSSIDVEAWLSGKVADKFSRVENTAFVSGDGIAKPKGFLSYGNYTSAGVFETGKIEQIKSGSNGAFTYDGLVDLQAALKEPYQPGAVFMGKRASFAALMKLKDGENHPIFNLMFDKNVGLTSLIMGQRFVFADDMPAIANDALSLAYGDFRQGYLIVDRIGVRVIRDIYTAKPFVEFYFTKRVGGDVVNWEALKLQKLAA